jgi:ketosteroid isomerase-like protein
VANASSEKIEVVRRVFETFERKDLGAALEVLDPDFEWDYSRSRGPEQGIYRGREQVSNFWRRFLEAFSDVEAVEIEISEVGERVLRVGNFRFRGQGSGVEASAGGATLWEFRDGVPVRASLFQNKHDAIEWIDSH